jgi:hypothetical protein
MNETKPWYLSKTLWFNIACVALASLESNTGILQPFLPVNFYSALAVGLPVVNGVLRVITTKGLTA